MVDPVQQLPNEPPSEDLVAMAMKMEQATPTADFTDSAQRLRVMWNKGRNMYSAFYTELDSVRREVGDDQFADWCFHKLRISLSILNETARVLKAADASVVKTELAKAREVEKEAKKRAAEQAKREREEAKVRRELDRLKREEEERMAAKAREDTKVADRARKTAERAAQRNKANREKRAIELETVGPDNPVLRQGLENCQRIETISRVELGREYSIMKEEVIMRRAGKNASGKLWTWGEWASFYIKRSARDINKCIAEFGASCPIPQGENVVSFRENRSQISVS
jgi:flagellar biosynthesis GTPase FlhF